MSHKYDAENEAYEARLREMVLVDLVGTDVPHEELFGVMYQGECRCKYDDPIAACDHAEQLARNVGAKWDVTIQARNAADIS